MIFFYLFLFLFFRRDYNFSQSVEPDHCLILFVVVSVHPRMFLHPGPHYTVEGKNVTLPICHVIGYPQPVVTWSKLSGQLPQGRVKTNTSALTIFFAHERMIPTLTSAQQ